MTDKELIKQIKKYNPLFDYDQWLDDIKTKKDYIQFGQKTNLNQLYDIISRNNNQIFIKKLKNDIIYTFEIPEEKDRKEIKDLLKKYGINTISTKTPQEFYFILHNDPDYKFLKSIILIWIYRMRDYEYFTHMEIEMEGFPQDVIDYIYDIYNINKSTQFNLSDQLKYLTRKNEF